MTGIYLQDMAKLRAGRGSGLKISPIQPPDILKPLLAAKYWKHAKPYKEQKKVCDDPHLSFGEREKLERMGRKTEQNDIAFFCNVTKKLIKKGYTIYYHSDERLACEAL